MNLRDLSRGTNLHKKAWTWACVWVLTSWYLPGWWQTAPLPRGCQNRWHAPAVCSAGRGLAGTGWETGEDFPSKLWCRIAEYTFSSLGNWCALELPQGLLKGSGQPWHLTPWAPSFFSFQFQSWIQSLLKIFCQVVLNWICFGGLRSKTDWPTSPRRPRSRKLSLSVFQREPASSLFSWSALPQPTSFSSSSPTLPAHPRRW